MKKIELPIVGLRHHEFGHTLPSLFRSAVGNVVFLSIERHNATEPNAVMAYLKGRCLGYVRTGEWREMAQAALETTTRGVMMCKVVRTNSELREVWVELVMQEDVHCSSRHCPQLLEGWQYDGPTLLWDAPVLRLQNQAGALLAMLEEDPEAWSADMESALAAVEECGWADISGTMRTLLGETLKLLTALSPKDVAFAEAARRLQFTLDYLCSPEWAERRVKELRALAQSAKMAGLHAMLGARAVPTVQQLPSAITTLFDLSPAEAMGRLCYLRMPTEVAEQMLTVLALRLHLQDLDYDLTPTDEGGEAAMVTADPMRRLMKELMAAHDEEGEPIFGERRQWYAVYRVLKEVRSYPSQMSEFCQRMRDMGMDRVPVPCVYDSFRKAATDLPKLKVPVTLWQDYANISAAYEQQCKVADFLLRKLGVNE